MIDPRTWWAPALAKGSGWRRAPQSAVARVPRLAEGWSGWRTVVKRSVSGLLPRLALRLLPVLAPLFVLGCGGTDPSPLPAQKLEDVFWRLELNHQAVLLSTTAPWDTLSLIATPLNYRGDTLPGLPAPKYRSNDIEHVRVTPDGVLQAVAPLAEGTSVLVFVELTANKVTNVDTVYVRVMETTNPPPLLDGFSIHPLPPDSAKRAVEKTFELSVFFAAPAKLVPRATDPTGNPIPNVPVYYRSSDNTIAVIDKNGNNRSGDDLDYTFFGNQPGAVTFYASTTVFGVTKVDTLPYRIGWRLTAAVQPQRIIPVDGGPVRYEFTPSEVKIGTGGMVIWSFPDNLSDIPLTDIVFAEADLPHVVTPTGLPGPAISFFCLALGVDCNDGNFSFGPSPNPPGGARLFTKPGTYEYHSALLGGASGRIVVIDEQ